jgi:elongation factor P
MATTADIRNNLVMEFNGGLWKIVEFLHVKPGKGNAFVRTKLKNIPNGKVIDHTFRSGEKIVDVKLDARQMTYMYHDDNHFHMMDSETFDQLSIDAILFESARAFMKENDVVKMLFREDSAVDIEVDAHVILTITDTDPGLKGDTATGGTKPAFLETGLKVMVPLFLNIGDKVKVDTRSSEYLERVRE